MSKAGRPKNKIAGQFSARTVEMLESPAYRVLSLPAHRILARLEIEHAHHGGNDNGRLPVTYDQFVEYGIRRHAVRLLRKAEPAMLNGDGQIISGSPIAMSAMPSQPTNGSASKAWRKLR